MKASDDVWKADKLSVADRLGTNADRIDIGEGHALPRRLKRVKKDTPAMIIEPAILAERARLLRGQNERIHQNGCGVRLNGSDDGLMSPSDAVKIHQDHVRAHAFMRSHRIRVRSAHARVSTAIAVIVTLSLGLWAGIWFAVAAVSAWIQPWL